MVVMHAEYKDISIECGLWWRPECQTLMLVVLQGSQTPEITRLKEEKLWAELWKYIQDYFQIFCLCSLSLFQPLIAVEDLKEQFL